jgi:hypothetical protein
LLTRCLKEISLTLNHRRVFLVMKTSFAGVVEMSSSLSHQFIAAPIEVVRPAWEEFVASEAPAGNLMPLGTDSARLLEEVQLIPAEGGCFLVTTERQRRRWARTCRSLGLGRGSTTGCIEAFGRTFEAAGFTESG